MKLTLERYLIVKIPQITNNKPYIYIMLSSNELSAVLIDIC